jgi:serine phosphatase RsbU (regulator of sigma subunit)
LELAAAFLPAVAERVSGDFYLVAEGPQDSTVLVVGDVVGHGLQAARRASFIRTTFAATAPFSDDPSRLLSWANTALIERAGTSVEFVTVACVTFLPSAQLLRWAYAGHPPALWLDDGQELTALRQGTVLGVGADIGCAEGSGRATGGAGVLLYTDGLTEARHDGEMFGLNGVSAALGGLHKPHRPRRSPPCGPASPTSPTARSPTISASSPPASPNRAPPRRCANVEPTLIRR